MSEVKSVLFMANHRLNAVNLPTDCRMMPLQVLTLRYLEDLSERKNPLFTPGTHRHAYYEVHAPISGEQTYQFDNKFVTVHTGEVIIISPYIFHSIPYSSDDLGKFAIGFNFTDVNPMPEYAWIYETMKKNSFINIGKQERVGELFRTIFREASEERLGWMQNIRHLIFCLLCEFARTMAPDKTEEKLVNRKMNEVMRRVEQAERLISDNVSIPMTSSRLAEYMNFSVKQLNRDIKQVRGMTVRELIDTIKFTEARHLLGDTMLLQEDVANGIGFMDTSSFNRFFKRMSGMLPSVYKALHEKE